MKQLLTGIFCSVSIMLQSQVLNGGFESLNFNRNANYWAGKLYLSGFTLDTLGNFIPDSIVVDQSNYRVNTTDVYMGSAAMELRNAFNFTRNTSMPGTVFASQDTLGYAGFGNSVIPITNTPLSLSFFYKFTQVNSDIAYASITIFDEFMNPIGKGEMFIGANVSNYTEVTIPVNYTGSERPAFMEIVFSTAIPGGSASLGSSLLIDEVNLSTATTDINVVAPPEVNICPNPSSGDMSILTNKNIVLESVTLTDLTGKVINLESNDTRVYAITDLRDGVYVVAIKTTNKTYQYKLVVKR